LLIAVVLVARLPVLDRAVGHDRLVRWHRRLAPWPLLLIVAHPLARAWWISVWLATAGMVIVYRIGLPIWRSLYHRLRVVAVQPESPGVVSLLVEGHHLDRLPVAGGQFLRGLACLWLGESGACRKPMSRPWARRR
jgi:hypothetical protein